MTQSQLRNGPDDNGLFGAFGGRYAVSYTHLTLPTKA